MMVPTKNEITWMVVEILMEEHGYSRDQALAIVGMIRTECSSPNMFEDLLKKQMKLMVN